MKLISQAELAALLRSFTGPIPVDLVTKTEVKMALKVNGVENPYHGRTYKVSNVFGTAGARYESVVNERRTSEEKAPDFVAARHRFAVNEPTGLLAEHREDPVRLYLPVIVTACHGHFYQVDGATVADDVIAPWLRSVAEPKRQGLDKPVIFRNYALPSIRYLFIAGEQYSLSDRLPCDDSPPLGTEQ